MIITTSCSHRSPSTDDCKYSTPPCVSVCPSTVVGSLLCVASIYPCLPHITPSPFLRPQTCPLLSPFLSSPLTRQKHGAFLTGSDRPQSSTISTSQPPPTTTTTTLFYSFFFLNTFSNRKWFPPVAPGVALSLLMRCVLLLGSRWGDSELLVV